MKVTTETLLDIVLVNYKWLCFIVQFMHWSKGTDFYGSTCCSCPPWCHLVINSVISGIESIQESCALGQCKCFLNQVLSLF